MTNTKRLLTAFESGEELTKAQIESRYGIANVTATISALRMQGYSIYLNERKTQAGITMKYRLGTPSRAVVAAGYRALREAEAV